MRCVCFALLLSVVAISAEFQNGFVLHPRFHPLNLHPLRPDVNIIVKELAKSQEFEDLVNYLSYNVSPSDIEEMLASIPEALTAEDDDVEVEEEIMQRSVTDIIPWNKITEYVQKMAKSNSKFAKVLNLVNDAKFRELVKKTVNSHSLAEFAKNVVEHGFSWTEFLHLLLHGLCSAATTIQHDRYTVGVCQVLQNL